MPSNGKSAGKTGSMKAAGLRKGAPGVAKLSMDGATRYQVVGSGKLYKSQASANRTANAQAALKQQKAVQKAQGKVKIATVQTKNGTKYHIPGKKRLYNHKLDAQSAANKMVKKRMSGAGASTAKKPAFKAGKPLVMVNSKTGMTATIKRTGKNSVVTTVRTSGGHVAATRKGTLKDSREGAAALSKQGFRAQ